MSVSILPKVRKKQRYKIMTLVAIRCEEAKTVFVTFTTRSDIKRFHRQMVYDSKRSIAAGKPSALDLFLVTLKTEPLILVPGGIKPEEREAAIKEYEVRLELMGYLVVKRANRKNNRHNPVQIWEV